MHIFHLLFTFLMTKNADANGDFQKWFEKWSFLKMNQVINPLLVWDRQKQRLLKAVSSFAITSSSVFRHSSMDIRQ